MPMVVDVLAWVCLLGGGFFSIVGAIGALRLPDVFSRMHATGMTDTMGAGLILIGLMLQTSPSLTTVRLFLILAFLWTTSPVATHALAQAALKGGVRPLLDVGKKEG